MPDTFDDALLYDLGDDQYDNNDNGDINIFDIEEDDELFNGDDDIEDDVVTSRPFDQINVSKGGLQLVNRKERYNYLTNFYRLRIRKN